MDPSTILLNSLWAGLFATGLAVMLTAPVPYLLPSFVCAFVGRGLRDVCVGWGVGINWATVMAAAVVVLVAVAIIRRHRVSPVVLICGVLPLGAAVPMFNLIFSLMRISTATGEALDAASIALNANLGKVFVTSLAIALGLGAGMAIVRLFQAEDEVTV